MAVVAAMFLRDWRIARSSAFPFLLDAVALFLSAALFFYLGRYVRATHGNVSFFSFAIAGLAVLRLHAGLPRILHSVRGEIASGNLELHLSSPRSTGVVVLGEAAFELLRGLVLAIALIVLAGSVFGASLHAGVGALAGVAVGLVGAAGLLAGLAAATIGIMLLIREGVALGYLVTTGLPVIAGAYFPVSTLPQPVEALADALPFHLAVDTIRSGLLTGRFDFGAAASLVLGVAIELAVALGVARAGVEHARRASTLALE